MKMIFQVQLIAVKIERYSSKWMEWVELVRCVNAKGECNLSNVAGRFVNYKPVARVPTGRVVIGAPANYSKNQKDITRTAAKMVGNK